MCKRFYLIKYYDFLKYKMLNARHICLHGNNYVETISFSFAASHFECHQENMSV